jgi:zinc transporter 1/2/3
MLTFKIISILLIIIAGVVGGLIPTRKAFAQQGSNKLILGNAFAGGVFLGAGFLHMLPDGIDNFTAMNTGIDYPLALLVAALGFMLILVIDKYFSEDRAQKALAESGRFPAVLFTILAIHSIIAGMSLGLEQGLLSGIVILVAIVSHKGSAAFALGVNMVQNKLATGSIKKTIAFFSLMTPFGVILGTLIGFSESAESSIVFEAIFDSIAAGTFIYIATLEIISELFEERKLKTSKIGLILFGFAVMATIAIWT